MNAQTTAGSISGRVIDEVTRRPVPGAAVRAETDSRDLPARATTDEDGFYRLQQLEPGTYRLVVEGPSGRYRTAEIQNLHLPVSGFLLQDFEIRLITQLWQAGQRSTVYPQRGRFALGFFGPDADFTRSFYIRSADTLQLTLVPTASAVVSGDFLRRLPLVGRDSYALLSLLPGVTSGLSTVRGISVSAAGQRPSAGSFFLDGMDNSQTLVSGPLAGVSPEALQEWRASVAAYSAEFGGSSGYIVNAAVSRGAQKWHGFGYAALRNTALNAAEFQRNAKNLNKLSDYSYQGGLNAGGRVGKSLYLFATFDHLSSWSWDDGAVRLLPTKSMLAAAPANTAARRLLTIVESNLPDEQGRTVAKLVRNRSSVQRTLALARLDWTRKPDEHLSGRVNVTTQPRPDYLPSAYANLTTPLVNRNVRLAVSWTRTFSNEWHGEVAGASDVGAIGWDVERLGIPFITPGEITYPGAPATYSFFSASRFSQLRTAWSWGYGRQSIRFGSSWRHTRQDSTLSRPAGGRRVSFSTPERFLSDISNSYRFPASIVTSTESADPEPRRQYRFIQWSGFLQDTIRFRDRINLYFGTRYEFFQPPTGNKGGLDYLVALGHPGTIAEGLRHASLQTVEPGRPLFSPDHTNWAGRAGISVRLDREGGTLLQTAWGIFYDRPFDNLWQSLRLNNVATAEVSQVRAYDYFGPSATYLPNAALRLGDATLFQPGFRTPYAQHLYGSIEHRLTSGLILQSGYIGSLGRRLLTTDVLNRPDNDGRRAALDTSLRRYIEYRANQGLSNYHAGFAAIRLRKTYAQLMGQYTFGHAIDNQSEALSGVWTLNLANLTGAQPPLIRPAFTIEGDSRIDRASADYDQRHSVTMAASLDSPLRSKILRAWSVSMIAAVRSGTPWTAYWFDAGRLLNNRPDYVSERDQEPWRRYPGGKMVAHFEAFKPPAGDALGSLGRNALRGPGMYNVDAALSRTFKIDRAGESAFVELRVEAYNVLNHANLSNPSTRATDRVQCCLSSMEQSFAAGLFGREENSAPLAPGAGERARHLQLFIRFGF